MSVESGKKGQIAFAVAAALSACAIAAAPTIVTATDKTSGKYLTGDFHNHTTCSDGTISMEKLVKKATDKVDTPWGLDWFVQAGHGGNGNRNCTLVEDASLSTPAYPFIEGEGPTTTWQSSGVTIKGDVSGTPPGQNMWRWQSIQEFQYPLIEYLNAYKDLPLFVGIETVVPGHEHTSMSVISGQIPSALNGAPLPKSPPYAPLGNATALSQWEYCFDRGDTDTSRGVGNNWDCSVPGSPNGADVSWNTTGMKLIPAGGTGTGVKGHNKTLEGLKWMANFHPGQSYYAPAHLERAGPFNPDGNNGYNIESLRDFNNTAPMIAFGMETQPGHGASSNRGEYQVKRNNIGGVLVDSVGGTTYGGTGVYGAQIGGVWDALLGEGRNFWFFASSDWHNRGNFGPDDRRTTQDFFPGEYQRDFVMVSTHDHKPTPQNIVDGLRSGNSFTASGQLIDRLAFVACPSYGPNRATPILDFISNAVVEAAAYASAVKDTDVDLGKCVGMGEKLVVRPGADIIIAVVARDPSGTNYSPYTFDNPSLLQIGTHQPLNKPVLDHVDLIRGMVTGYKKPGATDYSGEWPRDWLRSDGTTGDLSAVPSAAKNTTAAVLRTFGHGSWLTANTRDGAYHVMSYRIEGVKASQYVRLRGTNMPPAVPYETDGNGNPLSDQFTNAAYAGVNGDTSKLRIPCTIAHSAASQFDGCPDHLAVATSTPGTHDNLIEGQKAVSYDVAAWADLWFYSNPIYVEVQGSTRVAGIK